MRTHIALALFLFGAGRRCRRPEPTRTIKIGVLNDMSGPYADLSGKGSGDRGPDGGGRLRQGGRARCAPRRDPLRRPSEQGRCRAPPARAWVDHDGVAAVVDVPNSAVALAVNQVMRDKDRAFLASSTATQRPHRAVMRADHGAVDVRHLGAGQRHGARRW